MPTFPPMNVIVGLMVVVFYHIVSVIIHPKSVPTNTGTLIHYLGLGIINLALLVMVAVVLVRVPTTFTPRNLIWSQTSMMVFWLSQKHCTEYHVVLSFSIYYSVFSASGSSFVVSSGDDKGFVGPRTIHLSSHEVEWCLYGCDFVSYYIWEYQSMIHSKKLRLSFLLYMRR